MKYIKLLSSTNFPFLEMTTCCCTLVENGGAIVPDMQGHMPHVTTYLRSALAGLLQLECRLAKTSESRLKHSKTFGGTERKN